MTYRLQWTERKKEEDYETGFGIGPRFHPRFNNAKVVQETDRIITFERIILDSDTVADQVHHLRSWDGNFDIKTEKIKKGEKVGDEKIENVGNVENKILKIGCPVCLQEVDTYTDEGVLKIENHNYRNSNFQCPGSGDELEMNKRKEM